LVSHLKKGGDDRGLCRRLGSLLPCPNHTAIAPTTAAKGIWLKATPELVKGQVAEWAKLGNVEAVDIPGYWYCSPSSQFNLTSDSNPVDSPPISPDEKVVLYLHAGGYAIDTAHPSGIDVATIPTFLKISKNIGRVLAVEYRLSTTDPYPASNPFPAALIDAIAGYNYLLNDLGFKPEKVIIMGCSAGGHLSIALSRYTLDNPGVLPLPSALVALHPWGDPSNSFEGLYDSSAYTNHATDHADSMFYGLLEYAPKAFIGPHDAKTNVYIAPASRHLEGKVSFKGFPRTFMNAGGKERLRDPTRLLRDRFIKDLGEENVTYVEPEETVHMYTAFFFMEPERSDTLKQIDEWIGN
jgi:acetyl esterase/lipase